jgi:hypothetical protein
MACPMKYVFPQLTKKYLSHISKNIYYIKENIVSYDEKSFVLRIGKNRNSHTDTSKDKDSSDDTPEFWIEKNGYYVTDGIFCSFNCTLAYIYEHKHENKYSLSEMLLYKLHSQLTGKSGAESDTRVRLNPAPSYRLLEDYGGHLSIESFRKNFNTVEFVAHGEGKMYDPVVNIFEKKLKL